MGNPNAGAQAGSGHLEYSSIDVAFDEFNHFMIVK
jgi:hypothetical protein